MSPKLPYCRPSHELESCDECVWVEIPTFHGLNLLFGNHSLPLTLNLDLLLVTFVFRKQVLFIFLVSWGGVRLSLLGTSV
jgi:hypothetical protein